MYCRNCGFDVGVNKFCPNCGTAVQNGVQQANTPNETRPVENFNLISAYKSMFKKYAQFSGRSRRSEYWLAYLANYIVTVVLSILSIVPLTAIGLAANSGVDPSMGSIVMGVVFYLLLLAYGIATIIPTLAIAVRRLHDTGKSGWYYLMSLIPLVGGIILLVALATDSQPGANQYGPNPKE